MIENYEKNYKTHIEVYTKHIEVSSQILQSIRNLTIDLKKYDENFKTIDQHFTKLINELEFLKLHVERSLKNHDITTAGRYEKLSSNIIEVKDDFKKFFIAFGKSVEAIKSKINFLYLGGVSLIIAIVGILIKNFK
jgi:hypothetical protein